MILIDLKSFRPQQGLPIKNQHRICRIILLGKVSVPNRGYLLRIMKREDLDFLEDCFRPQQGLTIMNTKRYNKMIEAFEWFPSPAGVNYYESNIQKCYYCRDCFLCFRPQQGLTIMNQKKIYSWR